MLTLVALAATPPSSGASTLHVTQDNGTCATADDGCSVATALAAAAPGDTIVVHNGVHGLQSVVSDAATGVTITAAPDESRPVLAISGPSSTLSLTHGTNLAGVDVVSTSNVALKAIGGLVERVRVWATGAGTVGVQLGDGSTLRNSTVTSSGSAAAGILVATGGAPSQLRGVSVIASGVGSSALLVAPSGAASSSLRAVNSILSGSGSARDIRAVTTGAQTATVVLDHSAATPAGIQVSGPGSAVDDSRATLAELPAFVDRGNGDLRQLPDSPTIDAGTADLDGDGDVDASDVEAAGPTDLDGTPRQLGTPDIGADEREMPPIVLSTNPVVLGGLLSVHVLVQPRGLDTVVTAEWSTGAATTVSTSAHATGNAPVLLTMVLGEIPSGTKIAVRAHASNSAGSATSDDTTVATPTATPAPVVAPAPPAPGPTLVPELPGALPRLLSSRVRQHWGIAEFRLKCNHTVSCRGIVKLTRLSKKTRWAEFAIAPGKRKTIAITLTGTQTKKIRRAGKKGKRALLEIRSTQMGSSFKAVRLIHSKSKKKSTSKSKKKSTSK